ncbi:MAG: nicotinate (nicotinamide) nucleotide adenylyltransferase [Oscillospiraceae bacterium]|nr:nicotinate (nicotinamide) nucleotide adenylyltransferase [Oscillospiraceae bacterium]
MDILLFGGSFDPVHNGHENILRTALEYKKFDKIIIMPIGSPGHKPSCKAPFAVRKHLVELAFGDMGVEMEVSDFEGNSRQKSYSYITVDHLKNLYPGSRIYFIIGADSAINMHKWMNWQYLAQNVIFLVFDREEEANPRLLQAVKNIQQYSPDTVIIKSKVFPVSSTQIRNLAGEGQDITGLVDVKVQPIIEKYQLYSNDFYEKNINTARLLIPLMLREKRAQHTYNVAKLAVELARMYGVDTQKAELAALLHDIMKQQPDDIMLHRARQSDIIEKIDSKPMPVLHGFAAADYARREMGIEDEEILMAIKSHTCGRKNMTDIEKVIYLADMLSEERNFPEKEPLLALARQNLDIAMEQALKDSINWLKERGGEIDRDSCEALEYFTALNHGGKFNG